MTIGSKDTGKTCLIKRFCKEKFESRYITTIGLDYGVNPMKMHGRDVNVIKFTLGWRILLALSVRHVSCKNFFDLKMNIFDMSGDEVYREVRTEFYENPNVGLAYF